MPEHQGWQTLLDADAQELKDVYDNILDQLGKRSGALGRIFHNAQNKIRNAATLKRLVVDLIDKQNWSATKVDIKGDVYEALLEKGAEEVKSGAGQYFTPRALIQAMVECMQPTALDHHRPRLWHRRLPARGVRTHHHGPRGRGVVPRGGAACGRWRDPRS